MDSLLGPARAFLVVGQIYGLAPYWLSSDGFDLHVRKYTFLQLYSCAVLFGLLIYSIQFYIEYFMLPKMYFSVFLPQTTVVVLMFLSAVGSVWAALTRHPSPATAFFAKASACHRLVPFACGPFESRAYLALALQLVHLVPGCAAVVAALIVAAHYYPLLLAGFLLRAYGELAKFTLLNAVLVVRAACDALHSAMLGLHLRRLRGDKDRMFVVRGAGAGEPEDDLLVFQQVYLTICEMADLLNEAFGTQMVIELLYLFVSFTWYLFMFVMVVFGSNKEDIPTAMAWSLLAVAAWDMVALVALTSAVSGLGGSAERAAALGDRLALQAPDCARAGALARLLRARRPRIRAHGFCALDETLLRSLVVGAVTYIVILCGFIETDDSGAQAASTAQPPPPACPTIPTSSSEED